MFLIILFGLVGAAVSSPRTIYHTLRKDGSVPLKGGNTLKFENNRQASVYATDKDFPVNTFRWVKVIEYREKNGKQGFQSNGDHVIKVLDLNKKLSGRAKATLSSDNSDVSISLQKVTELTGENILYGGSIIWDWTEPDTQLAIISETTLLGKPSFEERMVNFLRGGLGEQEPVLGQAEFGDLSKTHVLANLVTGKSQPTDNGRKYISTLSFDTSKQPRKFTLFSCCEWGSDVTCQACTCWNCHAESVPCTGAHDQTHQPQQGYCAHTSGVTMDCPIEPICYYPDPRPCEERAPSIDCYYSPDMTQAELCPQPDEDFQAVLDDCNFHPSDGGNSVPCSCWDPISYHLGNGAYVPCCFDDQGQKVPCAYPREEPAENCPGGPDQGGCSEEVCTYSDGSNEHPHRFYCDFLSSDPQNPTVLGQRFPCDTCCHSDSDDSTTGDCPPNTQMYYIDDPVNFIPFTCAAIRCSNSQFNSGDRTCRDCCMDEMCDHDTLIMVSDDSQFTCESPVMCEQRPAACTCQEYNCYTEPSWDVVHPMCHYENNNMDQFRCSDCCPDSQTFTCDTLRTLINAYYQTAWSDCASVWCINSHTGDDVICGDCCEADDCEPENYNCPEDICDPYDVPCGPYVDAAVKPSAFFSLVVLLSMCAFY